MNQKSQEARASEARTSQNAQLGGQSEQRNTASTCEPQVVGYVAKNARERIRVAFGSYNDHDFLDIRIVVQGADAEDRPTKQGVTIRPDRIPELRRLVEVAEDAARDRGLL